MRQLIMMILTVASVQVVAGENTRVDSVDDALEYFQAKGVSILVKVAVNDQGQAFVAVPNGVTDFDHVYFTSKTNPMNIASQICKPTGVSFLSGNGGDSGIFCWSKIK